MASAAAACSCVAAAAAGTVVGGRFSGGGSVCGRSADVGGVCTGVGAAAAAPPVSPLLQFCVGHEGEGVQGREGGKEGKATVGVWVDGIESSEGGEVGAAGRQHGSSFGGDIKGRDSQACDVEGTKGNDKGNMLGTKGSTKRTRWEHR